MSAIPILLYHAISADASAAGDPWCVNPERFEAQIDMVLESGFTPMTVSGLVDSIDNGTAPDRPIVITFDDGHADFKKNALPVLRASDVPSTMYVVTDLVGAEAKRRSHLGPGVMPMMTWSEVVSASEAGVEIGSHSATHPELDVIRRDRLVAEIAESRRVIGEELGQPARTFAYPYGYHSGHVIRATKEAGYDSACAVGDGWSRVDEDRFVLTRMFVYGDMTVDDLRDKLLDPPDAPHRHRAVARVGWRYGRKLRRWATPAGARHSAEQDAHDRWREAKRLPAS